MSNDRYTKIMLTLIATALWLLVLIQVGTPPAAAQQGPTNVNIVEIGGQEVDEGRIQVDLRRFGGRRIARPADTEVSAIPVRQIR